jgi:prepilin-type N-terminal cleavage/methylation domain-containing protein
LTSRHPGKRDGFTLIEVVAALLLFASGVLMMLSLTRALSTSMEHSALNSTITAEGQERMDSLTGLTFATLTAGTVTDTVTVRGVRFQRIQTVTACPCTGGSASPLVKRINVLIRQVTGVGPTYTSTGYISNVW